MNSPRNVYAVKVALSRRKSIWREIEILGSQTLDDLHRMIFTAFDRFDEHLYAFYLTGTRTDSIRRIITSPQYVHPLDMRNRIPDMDLFETRAEKEKRNAAKTKLDALDLKLGTVCYYLFDYSDEWWHELTVTDVKLQEEGFKYPRIAKGNGEAPPQYIDGKEE